MRIKKSLLEETHSYASTQVIPPDEVSALVNAARAQIDHDDLDPKEGFGPDPHVTLLYGLSDEQEDDAVDIMRGADPLNIHVDAVDTFEADDYDVVIFRLKSSDLKALRGQLDDLPNENKWPDYKPHMTIAYVQSGLGKDYVDQIESDLVGKNFVANELEFSNTSRDKIVVNLREGTTVVFEHLSEQSPLYGIDVLTEEPDENAILGALYPVLNRTNRRAVSINSDSSGQVTALLDSGASLDMTMRDGSWWAVTGAGEYDLLSPTDQERLVKELNGVLENTSLRETTATVRQDGYDLLVTFTGFPKARVQATPRKASPREKPAQQPAQQPRPESRVKPSASVYADPEQQAGFESVAEQGEARFDYIDEILPILQKDAEFAELGEFKSETLDTVRFVPHVRNWQDVRDAADRIKFLLTHAGSQVRTGPRSKDRIDAVSGVTRGDNIQKGRPVGGGRDRTWRERLGSRKSPPMLQPAGEYRSRVGNAPGSKKVPVSGYSRAQDQLEKKKSRKTVGAEEDTYTSDVSNTETIPITRPEKKRRRGALKLLGIKDAARRRVNHVYNIMNEGISKSSIPGRAYDPIRVVMRPSQVEALEKKPVWSALRESGVISVKPFKMAKEEFFEINIDTLRREWNDANTETLLDEVGAVSPQAQTKIIERVDPEVAAKVILKLVDDIAGAQAEADIEDGPQGTVAEWVLSQKLQGTVVTADILKEHLLGSHDTVRDILEGLTHNIKILNYLSQLTPPRLL